MALRRHAAVYRHLARCGQNLLAGLLPLGTWRRPDQFWGSSEAMLDSPGSDEVAGVAELVGIECGGSLRRSYAGRRVIVGWCRGGFSEARSTLLLGNPSARIKYMLDSDYRSGHETRTD